MNRFFSDRCFVVKAFYMANGNFRQCIPTEMGGRQSARWCAGIVDRQRELKEFPGATLESKNEFELGIAVRIKGDEYDALGRPIRIGWLDLPLLRHALRNERREIILSRAEVLSGCPRIRLCVGYRYQSTEPYYTGKRRGKETFSMQSEFCTAIPSNGVLERCQALYKEFPGWKCEMEAISSFKDLPKELVNGIELLEKEVEVKVKAVSFGKNLEKIVPR